MNTELDFSELSAEAQGRVDDACDAFESGWQRVVKSHDEASQPPAESSCPALLAVLARLPAADRSAALRELVPIDVFYRRICRIPVSVATYAQYPGLDAEWLAEIVLHGGGETRRGAIPAAGSTPPTPTKPTPPPLNDFMQRLVDSNLLDRGTIEREQAKLNSGEQNAVAFGERLVSAGLLTPFQFHSLLRNQQRSLLLGEYLILSPLGRGGMGAVYRARHRRMDRTVAVKVLPQGASRDPQAASRFAREIRAIARLSHPNIVAAHDAGEDSGVAYLVMEYIDGIDLSTCVRTRARFSAAHAVECIAQAAAGLEYAHRQGVIHRDIKPSNLILCLDQLRPAPGLTPSEPEGLAALPPEQLRVKVLDLGLARLRTDAVGEGSAVTQAGVIFGTPEYMAPEQAVNASAADQRSDIYSLGCTLYFLLVGRAVVAGRSFLETAMAHQLQELPSLTASRIDVPAELEHIFRRMTARQPDQRFASMQEVIDALRAIPAERLSRVPGAPLVLPTTATQATARVSTDWLAPLQTVDPLPPEPTEGATGFVTGIENPSSPDGPAAAQQLSTHRRARRVSPKLAAVLCGVGVLAGVGWWNWRAIRPAVNRLEISAGSAAQPVRPDLLICPADDLEVRRRQSEWAAHLGTRVTMTDGVGIRLCLIPPGEFVMGTSDDDLATMASANLPDYVRTSILATEQPAHRVHITRPFWISQTEVTVGQFRKFAAAENYLTETERTEGYGVVKGDWVLRPGFSWKNVGEATVADDHPASNLTWNDAVAFAEWLSRSESRVRGRPVRYRLPTEAEWEYACRAGTQTLWYFGMDPADAPAHAVFIGNSQQRLQPVGSKRENAFGLFDMAGNQAEWCQDWFAPYGNLSAIDPGGPLSGQTRVQRGGNFGEHPTRLRSAARQDRPPSSPRDGSIRLVREVG